MGLATGALLVGIGYLIGFVWMFDVDPRVAARRIWPRFNLPLALGLAVLPAIAFIVTAG